MSSASSDETFQLLQAMIQSLQQTTQKMQELGQRSEVLSAHLQNTLDGCTGAGDELGGSINEFEHQLESTQTNVKKVFDDFQQGMVEGLEELTRQLTETDGLAQQLDEAIEAHQEQLVAEAGELQAGLEQAQARADELHNEQEEALQEAKATAAAFVAAVQSQESELQAACDAAEQALRASLEEICHTLQEALDHQFDGLGETLGNAVNSEMVQKLSAAEQQLGQVLHGLAEQGESSAKELLGKLESVDDEVVSFLSEHLKGTLKEGLESVLEEAIETMAEEIAEQLIIMNIGATTTTALSPLLPALAAAKKILQLLNTILDIF